MLLIILQLQEHLTIRYTKVYVDNEKLLQQLKSFKRTINWNKYHSDSNLFLSHLVDPSFQGVNRLFVLSFENENGRTLYSEYHSTKVEIKDYNIKIDVN